ncbi:MAG: hypothetical protein ACQEQF_00730 [Bacillota bacterium]
MKKLEEIWKKISNTKSLLGIASALLIITNNLGIDIDNVTVMNVVKAVLTILVILGIINNDGMDTSDWNK